MTEGDESVIGYLKYCREQGMNYKAEITDMLQGGLYTYKDKVQAIMQVCMCTACCLLLPVGSPRVGRSFVSHDHPTHGTDPGTPTHIHHNMMVVRRRRTRWRAS